MGLPVVNRLVSLRQKFFMTDESPNFPDHDEQRSGSLINPEGYMILESHCTEDELEIYEEEVQGIQVDLQEKILVSIFFLTSATFFYLSEIILGVKNSSHK